jgi:enamine deaminase RidA (YjgF/YER057c/UK114 family)
MERRYIWPDGHWDWPIDITHKQGVVCGDMIWVSGQVDLTPDGDVRNQGDIATQARNAMANFASVLKDCDATPGDLVKLLCFYVNDGSRSERDVLEMIGTCLPEADGPAITMVPVPYLAYPGMEIEIEGYAMRPGLMRQRIAPEATSPLPRPFSEAIRCGKMIFVSGQTPVDDAGNLAHPDDIVAQTHRSIAQIGERLKALGAGFDDVVKSNRWYVGEGRTEDFEPAALACAQHYSKPGPAATGIPIPRHGLPGQMIKLEAIAMRGEDGAYLPRRHVWPDSLWDWTIPLPYQHGVKCHDMIFLGGQVSLDKSGIAIDPDELGKQTRTAMNHIGTLLHALGADYDDACKVTTFYEGGSNHHDLHENLSIRSSYFNDPGPATTGIPLPKLAYPGMVIEIEVFAMAEPDKK